jgi:predicted phosphodiesterase
VPRKKQAETEDEAARPFRGAAAVAGPLPEGVALVEKAIEVSGAWPGRLANSSGKPGGLIELPPGRRPIIVGDLHANLEYLKRIIDHEGNRADLDAGRACLIIVGDAVHDDRTGYMKQMQSSVEILDYLLRLFVERPDNVYYIRGNHDTFDPRLRKSGISQGIEFRAALVATHGEEYTAAVARFFESLPMFIIGEGFVITHAGPPRGGLVREELIDIDRYPEKYHQLMWNRVNEFHGTPSPKEYGEKDLRLVLDQLGVPPETHFIVGHNPLWNDGNQNGVWLDVIGIKNHHIIYSGSGSRAPYFTTEGGELVVKFAVDREPEVYYYG